MLVILHFCEFIDFGISFQAVTALRVIDGAGHPYFSLKLDLGHLEPDLELQKPTLVEKQGVRLPTNPRNAVQEDQN